MKALIDPRGYICEVAAASYPVADPFHWVDAPADCAPFTWSYDPATGCSPPAPVAPPSLHDAITSRLADLAKYRYGKETGGISVGGATIDTARDSQALITGAYTALKNGVASQVNYKAQGNIWITLTAAQFYPVAEAVFAHVQGCFDTEKAHSLAIQALTSGAAVAAYDFTTGWPT